MRAVIDGGLGRLWLVASAIWLLAGYWYFIGKTPWGHPDIDREIAAEMSSEAVKLALADFVPGEPLVVTRIRDRWDQCLNGYKRVYAWRDPLASFGNRDTAPSVNLPNATQYRCWDQANSGLQYVSHAEGFKDKVWRRRVEIHLSSWGERIAFPYLWKTILPWLAFSLATLWVYHGFRRRYI